MCEYPLIQHDITIESIAPYYNGEMPINEAVEMIKAKAKIVADNTIKWGMQEAVIKINASEVYVWGEFMSDNRYDVNYFPVVKWDSI